MKLVDRTHKRFIFRVESHVPDSQGVKCEDDLIYFYRDHFKSTDDCFEWFEAKTKEMKDKNFSHYVCETKGVEPNDEEWKAIQKFMPNPQNFQKDDFRVFEDRFANNFLDRILNVFR